MSLPPIVETTLQAALLSVVSNVVAQYIQTSKQTVSTPSFSTNIMWWTGLAEN